MKTLAFLAIATMLSSGCTTSRNASKGAPGPTSQIYHGNEFSVPGSNSGTSTGSMGSLQHGNSSQDSPTAAVPSAYSYQPMVF